MADRGQPASHQPHDVRPATLGYGQQPARRSLSWRHALFAVLLIASAAGSWAMGRTARAKAQHVLYERQVAAYVESAETVVYESDPATAAELVAAGTHRLDEASGAALLLEPDSYEAFRESMREAAQELDREGALIFLHELSTAGGAKRVVAVRFLPWVLDEAVQWRPNAASGLVAEIYKSGGWLGQTRQIGESRAPILLPKVEMNDPLANPCLGEVSPVLRETFDPYTAGSRLGDIRWYAGQPDVTDPAHFTVDFEFAGRRGTVDGYLSADGSAVHMSVRSSRVSDEPGTTALSISDPLSIRFIDH